MHVISLARIDVAGHPSPLAIAPRTIVTALSHLADASSDAPNIILSIDGKESRGLDTDVVSRLIGAIYDAALNPALWTGVLKDIAGFTEGQSAGIATRNSLNKCPLALYTHGCDPDYLEALFPFLCDALIRRRDLCLFEPEQVVGIADFMPYEDYLETRFYRSGRTPRAGVDSASAVLEKRRRVMPSSASTGARRTGPWTMRCAAACRSSCRTSAAPS